MFDFVKKWLNGSNEAEVKRLVPTVDKIEALEPNLQKLSDEELRAQTALFRERCAKGESLDSLLPEAFAVCREGARRAQYMASKTLAKVQRKIGFIAR